MDVATLLCPNDGPAPFARPGLPRVRAGRGRGEGGRPKHLVRPVTERATIATPIGPVTLVIEEGAVVALDWGDDGAPPDSALAVQAAEQMAAYFAGDLREFDLPLAPRVSAAQARFDTAMRAIPYGQTRTYGEMAADLGIPAQAAGQHCGANRIAIIIPCHRVLGATSLGGYSGRGGIEAKVALLRLEGAAGLLI